jgi:ribosomal protein S27E
MSFFGKKSTEVKCPKCGSAQITAQKKGFGLLKAVTGFAIVGPLGSVLGASGRRKIIITCLNCGNTWKPK